MALCDRAATARSSKRHGVALQALEIVEGKPHRRRPQNALPVVLRKPEIEGRDDLRIDL